MRLSTIQLGVFTMTILTLFGVCAASQVPRQDSVVAPSQPAAIASGEDSRRSQIATPPAPAANSDRPVFPRERHFLSDREFWLSFEVLLFGGGVILIEFLLLRRHPVSPEEALRVYAITLIIVGALFTVTAGFDNISVAPAFGLLGTVAGYLLGRKPATDIPRSNVAEETKHA